MCLFPFTLTIALGDSASGYERFVQRAAVAPTKEPPNCPSSSVPVVNSTGPLTFVRGKPLRIGAGCTATYAARPGTNLAAAIAEGCELKKATAAQVISTLASIGTEEAKKRRIEEREARDRLHDAIGDVDGDDHLDLALEEDRELLKQYQEYIAKK